MWSRIKRLAPRTWLPFKNSASLSCALCTDRSIFIPIELNRFYKKNNALVKDKTDVRFLLAYHVPESVAIAYILLHEMDHLSHSAYQDCLIYLLRKEHLKLFKKGVLQYHGYGLFFYCLYKLEQSHSLKITYFKTLFLIQKKSNRQIILQYFPKIIRHSDLMGFADALALLGDQNNYFGQELFLTEHVEMAVQILFTMIQHKQPHRFVIILVILYSNHVLISNNSLEVIQALLEIVPINLPGEEMGDQLDQLCSILNILKQVQLLSQKNFFVMAYFFKKNSITLEAFNTVLFYYLQCGELVDQNFQMLLQQKNSSKWFAKKTAWFWKELICLKSRPHPFVPDKDHQFLF